MIERVSSLILIVTAAWWISAGPAHASAPAAAADNHAEHPIARGDRLEIRNYKGQVRVSAWALDRVGIEAAHPAEETIIVERRGAVLRIVPKSWRRDAEAFEVRLPSAVRIRVVDREPPAVTLHVRVPSWLPVTIESPHGEVDVEGMTAAVRATTVLGDITVIGAGSPVTLVSISGHITLQDAHGRSTLEGTGRSITARDCSGDLRVETTSGEILLENLQTNNTEARSLRGDLTLRGSQLAAGSYDLSTHEGDIVVQLAANEPDAHFDAHAPRGRLRSPWPQESDEPNRLEISAGSGAARIRLRSFKGNIAIERP